MKKIKRLDKKDTFVEKPKKDRIVVVVETIAYTLIAIILVAGLFSAVSDPKEFFGEPNERFSASSRGMGKYMMMACLGILYYVMVLIDKIKEKIKK